MRTSKIAAIARRAAVGTVTLALTLVAAAHAETGQDDSIPAKTSTADASQPAGDVARAVITAGIDQREPVDQLEKVTNDNATVYFFTELRGLTDQEVRHRWTFNGNVMAEVPFNVGGNRWRVWSTKSMQPIWLGSWQVDVVTKDGTVLESRHFQYVASETASSTAASSPAPPAAPSSEDDAH